MKQSVILVQRGISALTHPVSGISGKAYGNAVQSAPHGGVIFNLSLEDYDRNAYDLIGNAIAGQQWVPVFVTTPGPDSFGLCCSPACGFGENGGPAEACYSTSGNIFCAAHAPTDAKPLFEGAPPRFHPAPAVVEREIPKEPEPLPEGRGEVQPLPFVGSAEEEAMGDQPRVEMPIPISLPKGATDRTEPPTVFRDPGVEPELPAPSVVTGTAATTIPRASLDAPPVAVPVASVDPSDGPPKEKVLQTLQAMVDKSVSEALKPVTEAIKALAAASKPKPPGLQGRRINKAPTEFQKLRDKAAGLGINVFQKSAAALEAEIDRVNNGTPTPAAAKVTDPEVPF